VRTLDVSNRSVRRSNADLSKAAQLKRANYACAFRSHLSLHFHAHLTMSASAVCHQFRAPAGTGRVRRAVNRDARGAKVRGLPAPRLRRDRIVSFPTQSASRPSGLRDFTLPVSIFPRRCIQLDPAFIRVTHVSRTRKHRKRLTDTTSGHEPDRHLSPLRTAPILVSFARCSSLLPKNHLQNLSFQISQRVAIRAAPQTSAASTVSPRKVLIVNTNGGGHANIGFWLAKTLVQQGHQVTLNVVGDKDDKKMQKPPFSYFPELTSLGVRTTWSDPCDLASKASGEKFDVVVDNNGKDLASVGPVADFAEAAGAKQFFFVSSAGMYKPTNTPPHLEGDAVKETAGHAVVEQMLFKKPFAASCFRPQYFTGYGNNKDCEEWFFDRIVRGRPVPVPGSGDQVRIGPFTKSRRLYQALGGVQSASLTTTISALEYKTV